MDKVRSRDCIWCTYTLHWEEKPVTPDSCEIKITRIWCDNEKCPINHLSQRVALTNFALDNDFNLQIVKDINSCHEE